MPSLLLLWALVCFFNYYVCMQPFTICSFLLLTDSYRQPASVAAMSTGSLPFEDCEGESEDSNPETVGGVDISFYDRHSTARNNHFFAPKLIVFGEGSPVVALLLSRRLPVAEVGTDEERKRDVLLNECLEVIFPLFK